MVNGTNDLVTAGRFAETPKLYYKLTYPHVGAVILDPAELASWLRDAEEPALKTEKVYLTDSEWEALPEFES